MLGVTLNVLNQRGAPALYEDIAANRPAAGFTGRLFVSTDTLLLQRDTGTAWQTISASSGTIGGSITAGQIAFGGTVANTIVGSANLTYSGGVVSLNGNLSITGNSILNGVVTGTYSEQVSGSSLVQDLTTVVLTNAGTSGVGYNRTDFVSLYNTTASMSWKWSNINLYNFSTQGDNVYGNSVQLRHNVLSGATTSAYFAYDSTYTPVSGSVNAGMYIGHFDHNGNISISYISNYYGFYAGTKTVTNNAMGVYTGFLVDQQTGASTTYGYKCNVNAATNTWGLYFNGTADNYLAGSLLVGSNSDNTAGIIQANGNIVPSVNNTNSIGTSSYYWNYIYSNKGSFSNSQNITAGGASVVSHVGTFTDIGTGLTGGVSIYAALSEMAYTTTASRAIAATNVYAGALNIIYLSITGSSTVTVMQSGSNIRSMYATFSQVNIGVNAATTSSITSVAAIATQLYSDAVHQLSIGTYYGVLITDSTQFYSGNVTNRWGLYQEGASDINFINGELRMGSGQTISASVLNTVTNKVKLIINGTTYYLLASTSGV